MFLLWCYIRIVLHTKVVSVVLILHSLRSISAALQLHPFFVLYVQDELQCMPLCCGPCFPVWCSNGTGRSGAYVTIYAQIERMKVEGIVDLFQYIKLARLQRVNLVQTLVWVCMRMCVTM